MLFSYFTEKLQISVQESFLTPFIKIVSHLERWVMGGKGYFEDNWVFIHDWISPIGEFSCGL